MARLYHRMIMMVPPVIAYFEIDDRLTYSGFKNRYYKER